MSSLVAKLWFKLSSKKKALSIMIVGLDNSGKTSILNNLISLSNGTLPLSGSHATEEQKKPIDCSLDIDNISHSGKTFDDQFSATQTLLVSQSSSSSSSSSLGRRNKQHQSSSSTSSCGGKNDNRTAAITMPTVGYNYERILFKSLSVTILDFSGQNRYRNLWQEFYNGVDGIIFVVDSSDLIRLVVVRDELENLLSHPYFSTLSSQTIPGGNTDSSNNNSQNALASTASRTLKSNNPMWTQKKLNISQGKLTQAPLEGFSSIPSSSNSSTKTSGCKLRTKIPILFLANKSDLPNSVDTEAITKALNLRQLPIDRHPWLIRASSVSSNQGLVEGFDWLIGQLTVGGGGGGG